MTEKRCDSKRTIALGAVILLTAIPFVFGQEPATVEPDQASKPVPQTMGNYHAYGTLVDVTDQVTPIPYANLKFISPQGNEYTITTNASGVFDGSIDTYVEIPDTENIFNEVKLSNPTPNPTGGLTGFYINIPNYMNCSVRVNDLLGKDITDDVVRGNTSENLQRGQYLKYVDLRGLPAGAYFITLRTPEGNITQRFIHLPGQAPQFNGASVTPTTNPAAWKGVSEGTGTTESEQWTLEIEDPNGNYVLHKKYVLMDEGENDLGLEDMLPNDPDFLQALDESFRLRGYVLRMDGKKDVYINTENVAEQTKTRILDYLTIDSGGTHNCQFDSLTLGDQHYSVSDITLTDTAGLPAAGTDSTWIYDYTGGGNFFAIWTDGAGTILAAYVNLTDGAGNSTVLQETGSCMCGVDDYNELPSMFNAPSSLQTPSDFDWDGFYYVFSRRPGTRGTGAEDDETAAGNLSKSIAPDEERALADRGLYTPADLDKMTPEQRAQTEFVKKAAEKPGGWLVKRPFTPADVDKLTPEQRRQYEDLVRKSVRPPDYFGFD